ncbi:hypothetical protein VTN02DRAFT_5784 [Thermoascus thermophilus]
MNLHFFLPATFPFNTPLHARAGPVGKCLHISWPDVLFLRACLCGRGLFLLLLKAEVQTKVKKVKHETTELSGMGENPTENPERLVGDTYSRPSAHCDSIEKWKEIREEMGGGKNLMASTWQRNCLRLRFLLSDSLPLPMDLTEMKDQDEG